MSPTPAGALSPRSLFKRIFLTSGLYSIPTLAQPVISTLMLPVITASLSREDYAVLGTLEQVGILLALLLGGCFGCSIGYFYYERDTAEERRPVIGTSILGAVFTGLLTAVVCWVLAVPLTRLVFHHDGYAFYLRFMILGAAPSFALEALLGWARAANRPRTYVIGALARGLVGAGAALILAVFFRLTILGMLAAGIASVTIPFLVLGPACWRATRPTFDSPLFVRMVKFYFFVGVGGLAMFCINFGDRLMLWRYASGPEIGDYVLAYKIGMLSILAYNSFYSYWGSNMFDLMKRDDAETLFARLLTYAAGAIVVPCLGLTVFARPSGFWRTTITRAPPSLSRPSPSLTACAAWATSSAAGSTSPDGPVTTPSATGPGRRCAWADTCTGFRAWASGERSWQPRWRLPPCSGSA